MLLSIKKMNLKNEQSVMKVVNIDSISLMDSALET